MLFGGISIFKKNVHSKKLQKFSYRPSYHHLFFILRERGFMLWFTLENFLVALRVIQWLPLEYHVDFLSIRRHHPSTLGNDWWVSRAETSEFLLLGFGEIFESETHVGVWYRVWGGCEKASWRPHSYIDEIFSILDVSLVFFFAYKSFFPNVCDSLLFVIFYCIYVQWFLAAIPNIDEEAILEIPVSESRMN